MCVRVRVRVAKGLGFREEGGGEKRGQKFIILNILEMFAFLFCCIRKIFAFEMDLILYKMKNVLFWISLGG